MTLSLPQTESLHTLAVMPHFSPDSHPALPVAPQVYFLSLLIFLFCTLHRNRIILYTVFCVWLLSASITSLKFARVVAGVCAPPIRCWMSTVWCASVPVRSPAEGHWVVFTFQLLWVTLLRVFTCKFLCECVFPSLLGVHLGMKLLVSSGNADTERPVELPDWFGKQVPLWASPISNVQAFQFLHILANSCYCLSSFDITILAGVRW